MSVRVNLYAAAAAAAGTTATTVDTTVLTLADLKQRLIADHPALPGQPRLSDVLGRCSFLVDGVARRDDTQALDGVDAVDVLPPFAGG